MYSFEQVYARWRPYVLVCLIRHVPDDELDDALQEVFLRIWRGLPAYQERTEASLRGWMARIARNYLIDRHRRIETHPQSGGTIRETDAIVEWTEPLDLEPYMACMSPKRQEVVRLILDGYSVPEVAEMLHEERPTVRSTKARGLQQLRDALKGPLST